ncbi:MAG: hypothetical protein OSB05_12345 [Akkermansiaceae bacterium]|nr:hypothetical protein [Akkermansiaceae bacterium]
MLITHPEVTNDLAVAIASFDSKSKIAGDEFLQAGETAGEQIKENPLPFHEYRDRFRRSNLRGFPSHIIYEVDGDWLGMLSIKHDRRHPRAGLDRTWFS